MNESGPVNRPKKISSGDAEYSDITPLSRSVYRATLDGKYWILKTARSDDASSGILLHREYELSCNLNHPNILNALFYLDKSPVGPAIAMEYIGGRTLDEFIKEGKASVSLRRKILFQIFDAVDYIHKIGLLHNDIKPANILITDIGNDVKIIDFGFSEKDSDYLNRKLGGTDGASAPETLTGDISEQSVASSDIYSLGGIIRLLFPVRLSSVVRKCLRTDPKKRFRYMESLRNAVRRTFVLPYMIAVVAVILSMIMISVIPEIERQSRERVQKQEQLEQKIRISEIEEYLNSIYIQSADSLSNRELVPSQMQAFPVKSNFVEKYVEFRSSITEQEMLFVCDTIYARLISSLSEMMIDLPVE